MDYKTFADAYSHNRRSKEHLLNIIKTRVDTTPEFSLFLGSGASVSSGVVSAQQMIKEWQKLLFSSHSGDMKYNEWLKKQDWYKLESQYSKLFELLYDQPSQRRAYIENAIKSSKPSWGYAYLTSLIINKLFNVVFTTNFDDLINESFFRFAIDLKPMVCAHDSSVSSVRLISERPKIIKLHGDFLFDSIKNTTSELQNLEANMRDKFIEFSKEFGLIVIGYSGSDQSIMDLLDILIRSESHFRNGIYWCVRPNTQPSARLQQLLRNEKVYWVEIEGFDEIMANMVYSSGLTLPQGVLSPYQTAVERSKHLLSENGSSSVLIDRARGDLQEVYTRINGAFRSIGLINESNTSDTKDPYKELQEKKIPYWQCLDLVNNNKYEEAIKILRELVIDKQSDISKQAWYLLVRTALKDKNLHTVVLELLKESAPKHWANSGHFLERAYFALFLNLSEEALEYTNRSIELNSESIEAHVNKGVALLMLGKEEDLIEVTERLINSNQMPHIRSAGYALSGDLENTLLFLQKSFALGDYSPEDACMDVVFRPYWGIPQFVESLKPFTSDLVIFPHQESCPMSENEKKLMSIVLKKSKGLTKKSS